MHFVRMIALAASAAAAITIFAQTPPAETPRPSTPATINLFTTNSLVTTNLFSTANLPARPLGLLEALRLSLSNNFDVRIESFAPQISRTDVDAAKGVYDPVISANGDHSQSKTDTRDAKTERLGFGLDTYLPTGGTASLGVDATETGGTLTPTNRAFRTGSGAATLIGIRQPLLRNLWIDQNRYAIAISRKNLKISELAFRQQLLNTVSAVEQAYFEWIAARENVRVQEEAVSLARQQANEFGLRVRIGVAQPLDEQRLASQAARSEADLLVARRNFKEREILLVNLITTKYEDWRNLALQPSDELPTLARTFDPQASWTRAFEHRPDLHQLIIDLERLGLTEKLQYNQLFPTLDLTGSYGYNAVGDSLRGTFGDLSDANKPAWSVGLVASYPLGNRTARARLHGTRLEKDQANERLKQARQTIMVDVENAIIEARTDWERIPATRLSREYATTALEAGRVRLASGVATSLDILSLQRDLTAARSDEIRALVDYNKAITVLLQREGMLLEERGLTVNVQ
jgi:outer membrane protein